MDDKRFSLRLMFNWLRALKRSVIADNRKQLVAPYPLAYLKDTLLLDSGVLGFHAVHKSQLIYKVIEKEGL
jgi:hypothetical protein